MSQTLHQLYQSKAIVVTRTMVIKFHKIAEAINESVIADGYSVDPLNPASWKYYMNMFGEYHESDRARLLELSNGEHDSIRIKVAGETQPIEVDFNKYNISGANGDVAIANEYRFNTFYFNELVNLYPEFEELILGILNPIPTSLSTTANEGEILYCGGYVKTILSNGQPHYVRQDYGIINENYLIEPNEENLIHHLQTYIYNYLERWWNAGYAVTSNLFLTTFITALYLSIPQMLGNIRLMNAKTPQAHSFHIREHLDSWGGLGWVTEYLSKGVLLWLYRNMVWLNANRGKTKVFEDLISNVLTPSNIPITGFRIRHDVEDLSEDVLTSDPFMEQYKLNFARNSAPTRNEIIDIIEAEVSLASENYYDQAGQVETTANRSKFSMFDNLNSKVLESTVVDDSNKVPVTLEDIALNLWCFTASTGDYRGTVIFTNPINNERIQLTPLNAYILAFYCLNRGWANYDFEEIPTVYARLVHRHPTYTPGDEHPRKPTVKDVSAGVVKPHITDAEMQAVIGNYIPTFKHNSTTSFGREVEAAHAESLRKYATFARIEDAQGRGFGEWIAHKCYWYNLKCPLTKQPTKYKDWLNLQGLDIAEYTRQEFVDLGLRIVEAAIGVNIHRSDELRNKQSAALAVLKHFSSYTVQMIQNTVASDSYWLDWKHTRLTNLHAKASGGVRAQFPLYTVRDRWSIRDGVWWLDMYTRDQYHIRKETLASAIKAPLPTPEVTRLRLCDSARYKYPMYSVVNMVIPDVVPPQEHREYATLTTVPYPYGVSEPLQVTARTVGTLFLQAPEVHETETVIANARIVGQLQLDIPMLQFVETLQTKATTNNLIVSPPDLPSGDALVTMATIQSLAFGIPKLQVNEQLDTNSRVIGFKLLSPNPTNKDQLITTGKVIGKLQLLAAQPFVAETLTTNARVLSLTIDSIANESDEDLNAMAVVTALKLNPNVIARDESLTTTATVTTLILHP